jgi:putative acetyltransferase
MHLRRTDSEDPDLEKLIPLLDYELAEADGPDHPFFAQYNKLDDIKHIVIAYVDGMPVGCGAIKEYGETIMEIKRMFVLPELRGQGIAAAVLHELETWAAELGAKKLILETGKVMKPAIRLYESHGYKVIPNYGQYTGIEKSHCMAKSLS